jgi:hypothetical protein
MRYLQYLNPVLRPALEAIVLDAEVQHALGGHSGLGAMAQCRSHCRGRMHQRP